MKLKAYSFIIIRILYFSIVNEAKTIYFLGSAIIRI